MSHDFKDEMMKRTKNSSFFSGVLLLLIPLMVSGQRYISGRVTDFSDGGSIPGASVFLAETTVGINADNDGNFRLALPGPGNYRLVVSHAGYQPFYSDIEPDWFSKKITVALQIRELDEVTVKEKIVVRYPDVTLFWKTILGKEPSKRTLFALNPEAPYFYYNPMTFVLKVTCHEMLYIINNETGYKIQLLLNYFIHDYKTNISSWKYDANFFELEPENLSQKQMWEKNREKIYAVSRTKFIKALYHNSLMADGFVLTRKSIHATPGNLLSTPYHNPTTYPPVYSVDDGKEVYIPDDLNDLLLICFGKPVTGYDMSLINKAKTDNKGKAGTAMRTIGLFRNELRTPNNAVRIYPDGTYSNILQMNPSYLSGSLAGLNMILPIEYGLDLKPNEKEMVAEKKPNKGDQTPSFYVASLISDPADEIFNRFETQLNLFPQEKVYVQTDKPYYLAGEKIWFRAHVVDAASHTPNLTAGCVYVELFNAMDSAVCRVKTDIHNETYSGYLLIPEDAPEGDYNIRAYTNTMRNLAEDYFFLKNIRIANPLTRMLTVTPTFDLTQRNKAINVNIRFTDAFYASPSNPESVKISLNKGKQMNAPITNGFSNLSFSLPSNEKRRVMLLDAVYKERPYQKYIRIPLPSDDFDVSFYPEGGQTLLNCMGRLAFKAMQQDGTAIDINGVLYDSKDNEINRFKTDFKGMGQMMFTPVQGEKYHAVCTNGYGQSKRFELPEAQKTGYSLTAAWLKDNLMVRVIRPEAQTNTDTLYLVIHTRGIVQGIHTLDNIGQTVALPKASFPSGVSNLLLLTKDRLPLSERLIFVNNDDQARVECATDRDAYAVRSPVELTVSLKNEWDEPLTGSFSVSVTDDYSVTVDSTSTILTALLLSSDLRGTISEPAYYFHDNARSNYALDLLMLTQGWRRYDTERIMRDDFQYPDSLYETGHEITGTVQRKQQQKTAPVANAEVSILSLGGDYFGSTTTDHNGRFTLFDGGLTDSVRFLIRTMTETVGQNLILMLDSLSYPKRVISVPAGTASEMEQFFTYADRAEQHYVNEHGMRIIELDEVAITTKQNLVTSKSTFYTSPDRTITEREIGKLKLSNVGALFMNLGFNLTLDNKLMSGSDEEAGILIDDFPVPSIDGLTIDNIARVDVAKSATAKVIANVIGGGSGGTIIAIYTKSGSINPSPPRTDIAHIIPLGFQKHVEFYAPKYDTPKMDTKPDLRTTIHWQPNLTTDEDGKATLRFYTADALSTYSIVIEGVTDDGKIIYKKERISVIKGE